MVETALKVNPSLCVSSPLGHNPSLCRRRLLCIGPRAYFFVSVQPDKLQIFATRPLDRQVFVENFRTAHLNFWKQSHPVYLDLPQVHVYPDLPEVPALQLGSSQTQGSKRNTGGGGSKLCTIAPEIECLCFNKEHKKDQQATKR